MTEEEMRRIGEEWAKRLLLRKVLKTKPVCFHTLWGSKTGIGIYKMIKRIVAEDMLK